VHEIYGLYHLNPSVVISICPITIQFQRCQAHTYSSVHPSTQKEDRAYSVLKVSSALAIAIIVYIYAHKYIAYTYIQSQVRRNIHAGICRCVYIKVCLLNSTSYRGLNVYKAVYTHHTYRQGINIGYVLQIQKKNLGNTRNHHTYQDPS